MPTTRMHCCIVQGMNSSVWCGKPILEDELTLLYIGILTARLFRNCQEFTVTLLLWLAMCRASCIVASIFFFYGAGVTTNHHARPNSSPLPMATSASCGYAINAGVFAGGAIIALLATASAISYYLAIARIDMIWLDHGSKPNAGLETGHRSPAPPATHTT